MTKPTPAAFCVIPWLQRYTDEQGYHLICCTGQGEGNRLRSESGELLHVSQRLTDAQVLNSPTIKATRREMMRGEWPAVCARCRRSEEAGGESVRKHQNARFDSSRIASLLSQTADDGSLADPVVRYADIRLGNACNLTCRMCGPIASRLWAPIYNQVQPEGYRIPQRELFVLGANNWVKHNHVAWLLDQCLPHVEMLHFAGGEPLIVPEMVAVLEHCIGSGRAGEIELSYNTNLTVLPQKVTALWSRFRSVSLLCSVDGFGKVNEYIRRPSKWSDIDRNLTMVDRNFDEWKIRLARISCTTQIYNVLTIDRLFEYLRSAGFSRLDTLPDLVPLSYPRYLSIQALPAAAKALARQKLQREIARAEALNARGAAGPIGSIRATLAYMDAADTSFNLPDFLSFSASSDKAFGDSWRLALPELAKYLDQDCER